jgi:hypothetical protein
MDLSSDEYHQLSFHSSISGKDWCTVILVKGDLRTQKFTDMNTAGLVVKTAVTMVHAIMRVPSWNKIYVKFHSRMKFAQKPWSVKNKHGIHLRITVGLPM